MSSSFFLVLASVLVTSRSVTVSHNKSTNGISVGYSRTTSSISVSPNKTVGLSRSMSSISVGHNMTMSHNRTMRNISVSHNRTVSHKKTVSHNRTMSNISVSHNKTVSHKKTVSHNKTVSNISEHDHRGYSLIGSWRTSPMFSDTTGTIGTHMLLLCLAGVMVAFILCCMEEDSRPQHHHRPQGGNAPKYGQSASEDPTQGGFARPMSPLALMSSKLAPHGWPASPVSSPLSGYFGSEGFGLEAQKLCPEFIVSEPNGAIFSIPDMLVPSPQTLTLKIRDRGGAGRVVAQAVFTEPIDNLIRLETSYPGPAVLAVLDTTFASQNAAVAGSRHAILRRTLPDGRMDEMAAPFAVFFLNKATNGASLVGRCGKSPDRSSPLITALLDDSCEVKVVYDSDQRTLAVREETRATWNGGTAIRTEPGADALLVFCAVIAAQKLR